MGMVSVMAPNAAHQSPLGTTPSITAQPRTLAHCHTGLVQAGGTDECAIFVGLSIHPLSRTHGLCVHLLSRSHGLCVHPLSRSHGLCVHPLSRSHGLCFQPPSRFGSMYTHSLSRFQLRKA